MKTRRLSKKDIGTVSRLHQQTLDTPGSKIGMVYLTHLYSSLYKNNLCFTAVDQGQVIGAITATSNLKEIQAFSWKVVIATILPIILGKVTIAEVLNRVWFDIFILKHLQKPYLYISTLFADKKFQRKGIGKKLIERVLKEKKITNIYVDTYLNNKKAIKFYKALGFRVVCRITDSLVLEYKIS